MDILIKTIVDATPMLLTILAVIAFVNLIVLVGTHDDRPTITVPRRHRLTWDLTRDTRFINLD